jgi:Penicillin binding protein transpeptidase domain/NTF2-like N-terminal transpeptidase domain
MPVQGWYPDPYERHDDRWFSDGKPTRLVRDHGTESCDEPPLEHPRAPLPPDSTGRDEPGEKQLRSAENAGQDGSYDEPQGTRPEQKRDHFVPGMAPYDEPSRRRRASLVTMALISVASVAVAGAFAANAWPRAQNTAGSHPTAPSTQNTAGFHPTAPSTQNTAGFHPTAQSPSGDAEQLTTAFLRAWSEGAIGEAADLTDDPAAARSALTAYGQDLYLRQLTGTVVSSISTTGAASATTTEVVTFSLSATVAASPAPSAESGTWSYQSALTAYQVPDGKGWLIEWHPSVVAPNLSDGQHLATVLVASQSTSVTDSAGNPLSSYNDPGIAIVANLLAGHAPTEAGMPGLSVQIEDSAGTAVPGSQATVTSPRASSVATTINSKAEQAALNAVSGTSGSAIVVLQPSTGYILAIANNAQSNDFALTAAVPPGSTMKIITATALINAGLVSENSPVACPATYTVQGVTYGNDQGESEPAGSPFATDFALSCNNAFSQWWPQLNGQLASTAMSYYGLDQQWNIGLPGESASYFNAPADASGSELAQEAFGEGRLTASPLAMASVAATVDTGQFHQPVLVPGTATVSASPLPASTDEQLKDMMRDVVTMGTAARVGLGPGVYAKTGTADVQGQDKPNSWLVAFDPDQDVAIAALVLNAGYGARVAGPEVKAFFDGY